MDEEQIYRHWRAFWAKENHDRPLMSVMAPHPKKPWYDIPRPHTVQEEWTDTEYVVKTARRQVECQYYAGEAFPCYCPNLGPDLVGAVCGCEIAFGADTSWAVHTVTDWNRLPQIRFDEHNRWFLKIREITRAVLDDSGGDYLVGMTDLHPGTDALVSLRGPQALCLDLFEDLEELQKRSREIFDVYRQIYSRLNAEIRSYQCGTTCWMGVLHPDRNWYPVSSDFSCLISPRDYEQLVIPALEQELEFLDAAIYHLDGPDALRHLDRILAIPNLDGVQWVYGAGQPSARYWTEILRKIQDAGKLVQVTASPEDVEPLCRALRPEGIHLSVWASSAQEADDLVRLAERVTRETHFS